MTIIPFRSVVPATIQWASVTAWHQSYMPGLTSWFLSPSPGGSTTLFIGLPVNCYLPISSVSNLLKGVSVIWIITTPLGNSKRSLLPDFPSCAMRGIFYCRLLRFMLHDPRIGHHWRAGFPWIFRYDPKIGYLTFGMDTESRRPLRKQSVDHISVDIIFGFFLQWWQQWFLPDPPGPSYLSYCTVWNSVSPFIK